MMESERVQCRKCRKLLLSKDEFCLLDAHSQEYHDTMGNMNGQSSGDCASVMEHSCLYLSEESFPDFILKAVNESSWTKGKIHCPGCQARLGSFNFVSGSQCACGSHILPQVHILKSKVDWRKIGEALPNPVSFPDRAVVLSSITLPLDANTSTRTQQGAAGSEAAASNVSGENNSKKCSPAELTALESILSDLAVTDKSLKPRSESCKRVGTGKFEEPLRHKHLPKEVGVRQLSETVMVSNADLPVSSHFEVLAEQELTEVYGSSF
nr:uncharacterized protein LOC128703468 isoform X1 [Cherax quadricarinatus]XP_053654122.1 uncharacterized protein LOC128703468 isoform X1 [Cherax quadricarinatus]